MNALSADLGRLSGNASARAKLLTLLSLFVLFAYLAPLLISGSESYITIMDNLDGGFVSLKVLAESGKILAPPTATIENVMNGAPRSAYPGELNLIVWLFYFLGPLAAYLVSEILVRLAAFVGMYLLLQGYFLKVVSEHLIVFGVALTFALLPYYPLFGLSVAGLPLALYAFLNIRQNRSDWKDWLIIALIPFYSIFVLSYIFFMCAMAGLWLYDWGRRGRINIKFAGAIILMLGTFAIVDYRLFVTILSPTAGFVSHRKEFTVLVPQFLLSDAFKASMTSFVFGPGHARPLHHLVVLPVVSIAAVVIVLRNLKVPLFFLLLAAIGLISLWYGFYIPLLTEMKAVFKAIPAMNLSRFYFLTPLLWYVLFGLALSVLWRHIRYGRIVATGALVAQVAFLFFQSDYVTERRLGNPNYAGFFSTALYSDIDRFIGEKKDRYRVVSIGMHPSIAQYNGFYTLDGYHSIYPLAYKHKFRQLIAGELEKSAWAKSYYDGWGSRAYVIASDLEKYPPPFMLTKNRVRRDGIRIDHLDFNTPLFKEMGGRYVFSAVEVRNSSEIGLQLLKVFARDDSPWEIFVYQAVPD